MNLTNLLTYILPKTLDFSTLYFIVTAESLVLFVYLWLSTQLEILWLGEQAKLWFRNTFLTGIVLFPSFYGLYLVGEKLEPGSFKANPLLLPFLPLVVNILRWLVVIVPILLVLSLILTALSYYVVRPLLQRYNEWKYTRKTRLFDKKNTELTKLEVDVLQYFSTAEEQQYFIGITGKRKPVYLTEPEFTNHLQVVGPSGTGKTLSVLLPLAIQTLNHRRPLIFVDGKGDSKLKLTLLSYCTENSIPMKFFDISQPEYSHTYNPLLGTKDANELTNLLSVTFNLISQTDSKYYNDLQKNFLTNLFHLFLSTGQNFNFIDIVEFAVHPESRKITTGLCQDKFYKLEMENFLTRLSRGEKELSGLINTLNPFVGDEKISGLVNTYQPDIDVRNILRTGGAVLFSFSAGTKAQTNEALAKMVLADISNAVGIRHTEFNREHPFCMIILDEFGQYASDSFDKFISTARSANISCILSHQTNAQLETQMLGDKLARVVRENTAGKVIFRQGEEAEFWASIFGTKPTLKRTEQLESGPLMTEKVSVMGSIRDVEEFKLHPNDIKRLQPGQAGWVFREYEPEVLNFGMYPINSNNLQLTKFAHTEGTGLHLRKKRLAQQESQEVITSKSDTSADASRYSTDTGNVSTRYDTRKSDMT